jgi:TolA-binding protein
LNARVQRLAILAAVLSGLTAAALAAPRDEKAKPAAGKTDAGKKPAHEVAQAREPKRAPDRGKPAPAPAAAAGDREAKARPEATLSEAEIAAVRLVEKAEELLEMKESERGVRMLETVLDQYPKSQIRFKVYLILGRHLIETQKYADAIRHLRNVGALAKEEETRTLTADEREWYIESLYLTGVANFHLRQYGNAFTVLRNITRDYPNSVWANQAYYYIGMCHFAQKNWKKAIESLAMVGTFVDPTSPNSELVEAGRRLYVKIEDADIPVLTQLGKELVVEVETRGGDKEKIVAVPLSGKSEMAIGSLPTETGPVKPGDGIIQIAGGDEITIRYTDSVDVAGRANIQRLKLVQVVSSAKLSFTMGTYDMPALAAFLGQPLFILLEDLDLDVSPQPDKVSVKLVSRYKNDPTDEGVTRAVDTASLFADAEALEYTVRDEVTVELTELGDRIGRFGGSLVIEPFVEGVTVDKADGSLVCAIDDEIVGLYVDERHIDGEERRDVQAKITVAGEIDGRPMVTQNVVGDAVTKAKKELVEATAFLELTRIFRSMGLMKKATEKSQEGLDRVQGIIVTKTPLPSSLKEEAFKIKWELYIEVEDYENAIATCALFSKLYPTSTYADDALMRIGIAKAETGNPDEAVKIFQRVLALPNSRARAEAQFRIAESYFDRAQKAVIMDQAAAATQFRTKAMQEYRTCADRFAQSEYAGRSLARLVDYHVDTKDYAQADDLLNQIFQDYPDASFLDSMLLKWVIVCFKMGNYEKAYEKCMQLLFEYPDSDFAEQAKKIQPRLEAKVKGGSEGGGEGGGGGGESNE